MLKIGLTGGIGSGKSAVADRFRRLGVPVIDADAIAQELVAPGSGALAEIEARFGAEYLLPDGTLDRARMRRLVFHDAARRRELEHILHPRVRATIRERVDALSAPYGIVVIPLLLESGQVDLVDRILVVDAPEALQIERVMRRDGATEAEARAILAAQASREARLSAADDVIHNDAGLDALDREVERLHHYYLELARRPSA